jgi:broad specificity phosphatase PhoE
MAQAQCSLTTIYLMRHGQTEHNASGRLMGHRDIALDETGRAQATTAAALLASRPLQAIYSSDLQRARCTAEAVATRLALEVIPRPALREVDVGLWEGLTGAEIRERFPDILAAMEKDPFSTRRPGGESYAEMSFRVWSALNEIAATHRGEEVLAVSHGGPMRAIICRVLDLPWVMRSKLMFRNCGILALICEDGSYRFEIPGWAAGLG